MCQPTTWKTVLSLEEYHGDLSANEIFHELDNKETYDYILTNAHRSLNGQIRLKMSIKWNKCNNTNIVHLRGNLNQLLKTDFIITHHTKEKNYLTTSSLDPPPLNPIPFMKPHSLREQCRSYIDSKFDSLYLIKSYNNFNIPKDVITYVTGNLDISDLSGNKISYKEESQSQHAAIEATIDRTMLKTQKSTTDNCKGPCTITFISFNKENKNFY